MTLSYFISNRHKPIPKEISGGWNTKLIGCINDSNEDTAKRSLRSHLENTIFSCLGLSVIKYPVVKLWISVGWRGGGQRKGKEFYWTCAANLCNLENMKHLAIFEERRAPLLMLRPTAWVRVNNKGGDWFICPTCWFPGAATTNSTYWVAYTTGLHRLTVLEAGSTKSRYWQTWFLLKAVSALWYLVCSMHLAWFLGLCWKSSVFLARSSVTPFSHGILPVWMSVYPNFPVL